MTGAEHLYLWLNILSFIIPFLFSFYPSADFSKQWRSVLPAMLITAIIFILWDEWFTRMGIWGFNSKYLSGIYVFNLPLEEVLFFFCIPYACVFTYYALNYLIHKDHFAFIHRWITLVLIIVLLVAGSINLHRWYTGVTFVLTAIFLLLIFLWSKPEYMGRFYLSFLVILIPFFIVNGVLTGYFIDEPVVWYNDAENLGIRIGTIPVEDIVYALLLMLMNVSIADWLERRYARRGTMARTSSHIPH